MNLRFFFFHVVDLCMQAQVVKCRKAVYWYSIEGRSTQESLRWMEGRSTSLYENSVLLLLFSVGTGERKVFGRKVNWRFIEASGLWTALSLSCFFLRFEWFAVD